MADQLDAAHTEQMNRILIYFREHGFSFSERLMQRQIELYVEHFAQVEHNEDTDPTCPSFLNDVGDVLLVREQYISALMFFQLACWLNPSEDIYSTMCFTNAVNGMAEAIIGLYSERNPDRAYLKAKAKLWMAYFLVQVVQSDNLPPAVRGAGVIGISVHLCKIHKIEGARGRANFVRVIRFCDQYVVDLFRGLRRADARRLDREIVEFNDWYFLQFDEFRREVRRVNF